MIIAKKIIWNVFSACQINMNPNVTFRFWIQWQIVHIIWNDRAVLFQTENYNVFVEIVFKQTTVFKILSFLILFLIVWICNPDLISIEINRSKQCAIQLNLPQWIFQKFASTKLHANCCVKLCSCIRIRNDNIIIGSRGQQRTSEAPVKKI